jgi:hypothetical protein
MLPRPCSSDGHAPFWSSSHGPDLPKSCHIQGLEDLDLRRIFSHCSLLSPKRGLVVCLVLRLITSLLFLPPPTDLSSFLLLFFSSSITANSLGGNHHAVLPFIGQVPLQQRHTLSSIDLILAAGRIGYNTANDLVIATGRASILHRERGGVHTTK